jgi:Protein of unknown function (DUF2917)
MAAQASLQNTDSTACRCAQPNSTAQRSAQEKPMFHCPTPFTVHLQRGELLAWRSPRQTRLRVVSGVAWVTRSNDLSDHFLPAGTRLAMPRGSRVVISAESDLVLSIEAARATQLFGQPLWRTAA